MNVKVSAEPSKKLSSVKNSLNSSLAGKTPNQSVFGEIVKENALLSESGEEKEEEQQQPPTQARQPKNGLVKSSNNDNKNFGSNSRNSKVENLKSKKKSRSMKSPPQINPVPIQVLNNQDLDLNVDSSNLISSLQDGLSILAIAYHNMAVETEYLGTKNFIKIIQTFNIKYDDEYIYILFKSIIDFTIKKYKSLNPNLNFLSLSISKT